MRIFYFFLVTVLLLSGILVGCADDEALNSSSIFTEAEEKTDFSDSSITNNGGTADLHNKSESNNFKKDKEKTGDDSPDLNDNNTFENNSDYDNYSDEDKTDSDYKDKIPVIPDDKNGWSADI